MSSVRAIRSLPENVRRIVSGAYIDGLTLTFGTLCGVSHMLADTWIAASLVYAFIGILVGLAIKEKRLG